MRAAWLLLLSAGLLLARAGGAYSGGPPVDHAGIPWPAEAPVTCTACHSGNVNPIGGSIRVNGWPSSYEPGRIYSLIIELIDPSPGRSAWGFQGAAVLPDFTEAGSLATADPGIRLQLDAGRGVTFAFQNSAGNRQTTWPLEWTAPPGRSGEATVYVCGNAGDGLGTAFGDRIFCAAAAAPEATCDPPLPAVAGLAGARAGGDIEWSWGEEPLATQGYRLYAVADRTRVGEANGATPGALRVCPAPGAADTACTEPGAVADPDSLYYQVVAVCAAGQEGPN